MEIIDSVNTGCVHMYYLIMLIAYEDVEEELFILKVT